MGKPIYLSYEELREHIPVQDVRVQLRWATLELAMQSGTAKASLDNAPEWIPEALYAPWYKDSMGKPVSYDTIDARPWRYDELTAARPRQPFDYSTPEEDLSSSIAIAQESKILTLDVGNGEQLVLDGNHRLMLRLGCLASYDITMTQYRVEAPLELRLVPDVLYWLESRTIY